MVAKQLLTIAKQCSSRSAIWHWRIDIGCL